MCNDVVHVQDEFGLVWCHSKSRGIMCVAVVHLSPMWSAFVSENQAHFSLPLWRSVVLHFVNDCGLSLSFSFLFDGFLSLAAPYRIDNRTQQTRGREDVGVSLFPK